MLKTRVITAIVLLLILVPVTLWAPISGFGTMIGIVLVCAAWEWARLLKLTGIRPYVYAAVAALALLASMRGAATDAGAPLGLYKACAVFWVLLVPYVFIRRPILAAGAWRTFMLLAGIIVFLGCWHALVSARRDWGVALVLSMMIVVWLADIGAYFVGRRFGKRKLALTISPGKSWEGAIGGAVVVLIVAGLAIATHVFAPTIFTEYAARFGIGRALAAVLLLVVFSVIGDLFESLMKRQAGVKDSSQLLPGHGGVLDRVDALLPVLPLAMLLLGSGNLV
ncbi:phosphatidate cytidylyltransferase [Robbsia andropogonis]|uniref:Phosphatidate cytidylyltransferase n=1 Tax=Robbsia andropogonis TaxID=28092 RepID=A0A0F5K015_9BURK|nr:phosphatidate cytidylyltransferase [Robbsia andropogonis]KKB63199.1 phosphatidate cytidylyltransferase [Robbsia andropogonis]MCP1117619.1 phosphatidate cytidylyltransferase [Robbsia andropogonis]MCP1127085.1 phosphatidate cytidylyltransferase [Robbsia andropogonis]